MRSWAGSPVTYFVLNRRRSPNLAQHTSSGVSTPSWATRHARVAVVTAALASIDRLPVDDLTDDQVVTVRIIRWHLEDLLAMARFADHEYATSYITGYHALFPEFMADVHPIEDRPDAEAYIDRLEASADQMAQIQSQVERSALLGITPTTTGRDIAAWQIGNITTSPTSHSLVTDLVDRLAALGTISGADIDELEQRAEQAVRTSVLPGYRSLLTAVNAIEALSDAAPGVWALPVFGRFRMAMPTTQRFFGTTFRST